MTFLFFMRGMVDVKHLYLMCKQLLGSLGIHDDREDDDVT